MTDKKISALGAVSAPALTDVIPVVQAGITSKVDLNTLFAKIPGDVGYAGITKQTSTPETLMASGALSLTLPVSYVHNASAGVMNMTLANGTHGQEKTIVCKNATSNTIVTATQGGFTSITFTAINQTVTLKYLTDKWYIISSYGCTVN